MNAVFEVVQIKRKGLGCIATQDIKRKTLILKEEAQIPTPNKNPRNKEHAKEMVKGTFLSESTDVFVKTPIRRTFFFPETKNLNFGD